MTSPTSITEIDLTPPAGKTYWTCGREWREEFIYFLLVDRFHDNNMRSPMRTPERSVSAAPPDQLGRFCGGTLRGIQQHLEYIQGLGGTALWISPVLENNDAPDRNSNKYHGYAIQNYLDVDPRFGTKEDLIALVEAAHARQMRIFLDVVLNHSGDNWYYEGEEKGKALYYYNGDRQYPFGDWRRPDRPLPTELRNPDYYTRRGRIQDFDAYPETRRGDFYELKDFNNDESPAGLALQDILIKAHCYWLREADIDGFRMDAAKHMPPMAVARFCSCLHEYAYRLGKREFFIFGELTEEDPAIDRYLGPSTPSSRIVYHGLNSVVDYPLFNAGLPDVLKGHKAPGDLISRYDKLNTHALNRSEWGQYLVTFVDNHDQWQRFAAEASDKQVIAAIGYLLCAIGTACIYYGTEQGFTGHGSKAEFVREPLFDLANPTRNYLNPDCRIYQEIAKLAQIHHSNLALRFGRMYFREISSNGHDFALPQAQPCTLAFSRILVDQEVLVAYNTSTTERRNDYVMVDNTVPYSYDKMRFLYGKEGTVRVQKHPDLDNPSLFVQLELEPMQFVILINQ